MPEPTLPTSREAILEAEWLGASLSDIGSDDRVVAAEAVDSSKTLAEKLRIAVTVEGADGSTRTGAYCIKAHLDGTPGNDIMEEALFYRDLAPRLGVRMPAVYFAGWDEAANQAIIVMEDVVAAGGRFMSPHHPYTTAFTRDTLSQLALLHASTWGKAGVEDLTWLTPRVGVIGAMLPVEMLQGLLDDGRADGLAPELRDAQNLKSALEQQERHEETCVLHGDTHSGNTYADADGRACWLDWQVVQTGNWATDVSYHLSTVLSVDDRRAHEQDLLDHYLTELAAMGAPAPGRDEAWELYRRSFPYGYLLWVITQVRGRDEVMAHMPRIGAAMADHGTYQLLGVV